ncbi:PTS sugar transporter subunit IIA [Lentibacillus kapialis]|uniref:PTS sugar transporter subunit IIA n=1 Tax=Lentibacillus kapialis TaxID=340214 RepID=A0A917UZN3_9BACI|nr:PTS sugar transporter subunit IIA [Lentibacillus kapialis]GGK00638.1 PTS sugar transporter subunit IIA [Lentibacillus kapialis]
MEIKEYFHDSCVYFLNLEHRDDVLKKMSENVQEQSLVKASFGRAILDREKEFPTGLDTDHIGVALPHTDKEHVITPFIAVGVLEHPVSFQLMGGGNVEIEVDIVFMLGVTDPSAQVEVLQQLMEMIQNEELSNKLESAQTKGEVISSLQHFTSLMS